jgi:rare lipoprotein A
LIASRFALRAALPGLLLACTLPTTASASEASPSGGLTSAASAAPAEVAPASPAAAPAAGTDGPAEATLPGAGTWSVPATATTTRPLRVTGRFDATLVGRAVRLQRKTPANRWVTVATSRIRKAGAFSVSWRTRAARSHDLRLQMLASSRSGHTAVSAANRSAKASTPLRVAVVGETRATWFGPGFYGGKTACGLRLTTAVEGVAHRTLPCGTQVEVRLGGQTAVLPVIDRGPFANRADFDLTKNVADRIGLTGVSTIQWVERPDLPRISTPYRAPAIRG